uniref:Uncharacterized protein n=1 Tax=Glossina pallidipes TaxID=7398 RepID=A0A1A9ZVX3_GLOPL
MKVLEADHRSNPHYRSLIDSRIEDELCLRVRTSVLHPIMEDDDFEHNIIFEEKGSPYYTKFQTYNSLLFCYGFGFHCLFCRSVAVSALAALESPRLENSHEGHI